MASIDEFAPIGKAPVFIFTANIVGRMATATDTDHPAVTSLVRDVIQAPVGMRGLAEREVNVHPRKPLSEPQYVPFADPVSVGSTITVKKTAHGSGRRLALVAYRHYPPPAHALASSPRPPALADKHAGKLMSDTVGSTGRPPPDPRRLSAHPCIPLCCRHLFMQARSDHHYADFGNELARAGSAAG